MTDPTATAPRHELDTVEAIVEAARALAAENDSPLTVVDRDERRNGIPVLSVVRTDRPDADVLRATAMSIGRMIRTGLFVDWLRDSVAPLAAAKDPSEDVAAMGSTREILDLAATIPTPFRGPEAAATDETARCQGTVVIAAVHLETLVATADEEVGPGPSPVRDAVTAARAALAARI